MDKKSILKYLPLETERLIIRTPMPDDAEQIQNAKEALEETLRRWMEWSDDFGMSRQGLDDWLTNATASKVSIPLIGLDKLSGKFVLATGIDTTDEDFSTVSTGWWLAKGYEGQGLAYESMSAIFNFVQETIGTRMIKASYYEGNTRSQSLMERLGMNYAGTEPKAHTSNLTGEKLDVITYERNFR